MASKGDKVTWSWGNGTAAGTVKASYACKIKGAFVTRDGTKDDPALFMAQEEGDGALKLSCEARKA